MAGPKTLLKAVTSGRTRQVRLLLDLGASTEDTDECGQTPLIRAVFIDNDRNRDKILKMLLKKGSIVSKADVVGRSALSWACMYGRDKDVVLLLEYADVDLDLNKADINGQTALFHAVSSGNAATVKLLVNSLRKYDLSADVPDSSGVSPLMHANRLGYDICASILIYEGNARVGLGQNNQDKFTRMEKWAISSLRERSRAKNLNRQSQFPPIANRPDDRLPRAQRRQKQHRGRKVANDIHFDSDSSSEDGDYEDSLFLGHQGVLTTATNTNNSNTSSPRHNTHVRNALQHAPPCHIPPAFLKSPTLSSLCNVSSDNESEVDSVASTIVEGRPLQPPLVDLSSMYGLYQEQISSSFRQPAKKLPEKPIESTSVDTQYGVNHTDSTQTENEKGKRNSENQTWSKLKKNMRMTGLTKHIKGRTSKKVVDSSPMPAEKTDSPRSAVKLIACLPDIYVERKVHLLQNPESRILKPKRIS